MKEKIKMKDRFKKAKPFRDAYPHTYDKPKFIQQPEYVEGEWVLDGPRGNYVSFVGLAELGQVPSNVAVIAIDGNGRSNSPNRYERFISSLLVTINSSNDGEWKSKISDEVIQQIHQFILANADHAIVVQCGAGEQRSVALAAAIDSEFDRHLDTGLPGCKGSTRFMDMPIYRGLRDGFSKLNTQPAIPEVVAEQQ